MKRDDPAESTSQTHITDAEATAVRVRPRASRRGNVSTLADDPLWYKDAII